MSLFQVEIFLSLFWNCLKFCHSFVMPLFRYVAFRY